MEIEAELGVDLEVQKERVKLGKRDEEIDMEEERIGDSRRETVRERDSRKKTVVDGTAREIESRSEKD